MMYPFAAYRAIKRTNSTRSSWCRKKLMIYKQIFLSFQIRLVCFLCNVSAHNTWMTTVFRTLKTKTDSPACLENTLFKLLFHTNVTVFVRTCDDSLCHMFVSNNTLANRSLNKCNLLRLARLHITYFLLECSCRHGNITACMNLT